MTPITFAIAGSGWRADFYLRIARAHPDRFQVVGLMSRNEAKRQALEQTWGVRVFASVEEMVAATSPHFVVTSVPWEANPVVVRQLVELGMPVLSETPPAPDLDGLIEINKLAERGAKIQVAEQFHLQPHHAARIAVARSGVIGRVSQAQISAGHGYHGISLIRKLLGVGFEPVVVSGFTFTSPLIDGPNREGPPREERIIESEQMFLRFDFGDKLGLLDFTVDQYFSWVRNERVLVRGERGEIVNQSASYLKDYLTPIQLDFVRHATGVNGNLDGNYLSGIQFGDEWVYRPPFVPEGLTDEEIAIATCLIKMAEYVKGGPSFYSLAEASQDHYLYLMGMKAIETGTPIQTRLMPWANVQK